MIPDAGWTQPESRVVDVGDLEADTAIKLIDAHPPRSLLRLVARLPILLYRAHLGWLLDDRFLMLTHIGRRSGLPRHVVLEVVRHDKCINSYVVASGWGKKSDWFRNVQKTPEVLIRTGRRRFKARALELSVEEAAGELRSYARRHPLAIIGLSRLIAGCRLSGTQEDCLALARMIPLVAFQVGGRIDT